MSAPQGPADPSAAAAGLVSSCAAATAALEAGRRADAGSAFADAAWCAHVLQDDGAADRLYARAVPLLRAAGADPVGVAEVVVRWTVCAPVAAGTASAVVEHADSLAALLEAGSGDPAVATQDGTTRRRALADLLAATSRFLHASGGATAEGADRALAAADRYAGLRAHGDAGEAFRLAGHHADAGGSTDDAVRCYEAAIEAFTAALAEPTRPAVQHELAVSLAGAASDLRWVLRASGQDARADAVQTVLDR